MTAKAYDGPGTEFESFLADEAICDIRIQNSKGQFINLTSNTHSPFAEQMFSNCSYLDMELSVDDDAENSEHNCKLIVYNLIFDENKYDMSNNVKHTIDIDLYWKNDASHTTHFTFIVDYEETDTERSGADWKTTFVGTLTQNVILKNINFYKDYRESCDYNGGEDSKIFCPRLSKLATEAVKMYGIQIDYTRCGDIELRVYLEGKTFYDIINEYADYAYLHRNCKCMVVNDHRIVFYKNYADLIDPTPLPEPEPGTTSGNERIIPVAKRINLSNSITNSRVRGETVTDLTSANSVIENFQYGTENRLEENSSTVVAIKYENIIKYRRAKKDVKIECYGLPNVRKGKAFIIDYGKFEYEGYGLSKQKLTYVCNELHTKYDLNSNGWTQEITAVCTENPDKPTEEDTILTEEIPPEIKPDVSPEVAPNPEDKLTQYSEKYNYHRYWNKITSHEKITVADKYIGKERKISW